MNPFVAPIFGLVLATPFTHAADPYPFVIPWDDATPSVTDLSGWNEKPAGASGFIASREGHLFAGKQRFRIFGVNFCFGANFPTKEAAPKLAAHLAKLGVNCVRFHHMDSQQAPAGLFAKDGNTFDPERLDRLDYFIAQLKSAGIYADLNLHVSRIYPDRPKAEKLANPNYDKGIDNFDPTMIRMQRDYARALLTHHNPYTGNSYAQEPAVALIELNNENALLDEWHHGGLDQAAAPYRKELGALWTDYLAERHDSDEKIATFFNEGAREAGPELLSNDGFTQGGQWLVEQHEGTTCTATFRDGSVELAVAGAAKEPWHAQMNHPRIRVEAGSGYAVRFRAKASAAEEIRVVLSQSHEPWQVFDSRALTLSPEWREYEVQLHASASDSNARISFSNLARSSPTTFAFAGISLRRAAIEGAPSRDETGHFPAFTRDDFARHTPAVQQEWLRFLWDLEERYWPEMRRFVREDLGARPLIVGTQLGWSPFPIQQQMDVIDSHAYWQHPHFPGRPWDPENWTVQNISMAGRPDGGTIPRLATQRVAGKPYICTEYNHAAPNSYSAETFPLICAYAALQDWDGVFAFAYSHRTDDWDTQHFGSFFDIDQHPVKLATLPGALALFRRADVHAAKEARVAEVSAETAVRQTGISGPRLGAELFGVPALDALVHRVGIQLEKDAQARLPDPAGPRITSDTSELTWDTAQRRVLVSTPRSKAFIGTGERQPVDLGNLRVTVESEWAVVQATVLDQGDFSNTRRILITATASAENTGMRWRDDSKTSVGRQWGKAPSLVEGVTATAILPAGKPWRVWALDPRGNRSQEVPVEHGAVTLGPQYRTLWYEASAE